MVNNIFKDDDGNVISMEVKIQDTVINLVCVYGPNSNDLDFLGGLKARWDYNGFPTIKGGDFNTVIDNRGGDLSVDRMGEGACPNLQNSLYLKEWIEEGELVDPFRVLYPEKVEFSFN